MKFEKFLISYFLYLGQSILSVCSHTTLYQSGWNGLTEPLMFLQVIDWGEHKQATYICLLI